MWIAGECSWSWPVWGRCFVCFSKLTLQLPRFCRRFFACWVLEDVFFWEVDVLTFWRSQDRHHEALPGLGLWARQHSVRALLCADAGGPRVRWVWQKGKMDEQHRESTGFDINITFSYRQLWRMNIRVTSCYNTIRSILRMDKTFSKSGQDRVHFGDPGILNPWRWWALCLKPLQRCTFLAPPPQVAWVLPLDNLIEVYIPFSVSCIHFDIFCSQMVLKIVGDFLRNGSESLHVFAPLLLCERMLPGMMLPFWGKAHCQGIISGLTYMWGSLSRMSSVDDISRRHGLAVLQKECFSSFPSFEK